MADPREDALNTFMGGTPTLSVVPDREEEEDALDELMGVAPPPDPALNVEVSRDTNPDTYAEQRKTAQDTGLPIEAVEAAPEEPERDQRKKALDGMFGGAPATARFLQSLDNAKAAHDAVENLSTIERLSRGFQRGELLSQLGYAGLELRAEPTSEERQQYVAGLQKRLQALGEDTEGFVSALAGVTEFFGQRVAAMSRPRAAIMTAEGAAIGAAAGGAGGVFAPITVPAGAAGGAISGFVSHSIMDIGEVEAGLSYVEQLEAGVDPKVARWTSLGVGIVNAGLETLGGASFLRPLTDAGKKAFREGLRGVVNNPAFLEAAGRFAGNYGLNVGIETATEVAQEVVNIAAEELGKELTAGKEAEWTPEEWSDRLSKIAIKTLKTTAILGAPGPTIGFAHDIHKARKAKANADTLDQIRAELEASPLTERSPEQAAEHVSETFADLGVYEVFVPIEALEEVASTSEDAQAFYENLGVADQIEDAKAFNGDVRVKTKEFSQYILQSEAYSGLKDHIRMDEDSLTVAEGEEFEEFAEEDDIAAFDAVTAEEVSRDTIEVADPAVELAEHEMGMATMFKTAAEAGMSEAQYASYLEAYVRSNDAGRKRKERARLKRQQKKVEKKYIDRREEVRQWAWESASQEPTYQALLAIGRERLDRQEVLDILDGDEEALKNLPKHNGRTIFAPRGEEGISPHVLADVYGLESGDQMIFDWLFEPTFDEIVEQRTDALMEQEEPTLISDREEIEEALEALHVDQYGAVLAFELARLRQMRGQKRLKHSLVKARAKKIIEGYKLSDISPRQLEALQKREANRARKAIRAGDIEAAAQAKLNQLTAFEMTKQAYAIHNEVVAGNKFMKKFTSKRKKFPSLPVDYLNAIRDELSAFQLGPRLTEKRIGKLKAWAEKEAQQNGIPVQIPQAIQDAEGQTNYQDLILAEWRELRNSVRSIHKEGIELNKLRKQNEKNTVQEIADEISVRVEENVKARPRQKAKDVEAVTEVKAVETAMANIIKAKDKYGVDASTILLNIDSILRMVDGFEDLGHAYQYLKGGIDRAITEGYNEGQVGAVARKKIEGEKLVRLFDMFSKTERLTMWRQQDIPGVRTRLSRMEQIGVLLNMGNADNMQALLDGAGKEGSKQFTEGELQAIIDNASERDLKFTQGVWDYLEGFWPEIKETTKRRQNRIPERVQAVPLETKFGTFRGGYFPLRYDSSESVVEGHVTVEEAKDRMLFGNFLAGHTRDGHTQTRKGSGGRLVKLDPFILNNHVQEVIYDLEVGDAIADTYKVLHHDTTKRAFTDAGRKPLWDALDLWLGDITTGEIHRGGIVEHGLRHIRAGTTVSALAFNVGVALLQPLGMLQSSVQLGKGYMMGALYDMLRPSRMKGADPRNIVKWVTEQSGFMRERERSFNKDIIEAQKGLQTGWISKVTPGRTAEHIGDAFFLMIAKMQRVTDIITWVAAKRKGMDMGFDDAKATQFADRMVARTQGSGNFQERTSFERGTINPAVRQTEAIRLFSLFLNYFAAKLNVAYERTAKTSFRNPIKAAHWATDMIILFAVEGLAANLIKEGWPEEEEEDDPLWLIGTKEGAKGIAAGIPIVREFTARAQGFATGGSLGSFIDKLGDLQEQVGQGEFDEGLVKAINNVFGTLFRYPSSQMNKTGGAIMDAAEEEDVDFLDYFMGPKYRK